MEPIITNKLKHIDHIVLTTAKINDCLTFYQSIGFQASFNGERYELYAGDFKINVHLSGKELIPHAFQPIPGSLDLCFEITDLKTMYTQMKELGMHPSSIAIKHGARGTMLSFYVRDPDQNLLEFAHYE